jgi:D-amino-acid dehydrogenase
MARGLGVRFEFGVNIQGLVQQGEQLVGVQTDRGQMKADQYVMALGSYSPQLAKPLGIDLPVYPVKGFSITVPITDATQAPESTIMDETHKVAVTRLGDRIRVGGTAQLSGFNLDLEAGRRKTLEFVVNDLFPNGGDVARAEFWTGLRPMTPDGTPILGACRVRNMTLATGHGTLGWTMAAGTGRVIADLMSGKTPQISMEGLGVERYA